MDSIERGSKLLISNLEDSQEQEAGLEMLRDIAWTAWWHKKINLIFYSCCNLVFRNLFVKDSTAKLIIFLITYLILDMRFWLNLYIIF